MTREKRRGKKFGVLVTGGELRLLRLFQVK